MDGPLRIWEANGKSLDSRCLPFGNHFPWRDALQGIFQAVQAQPDRPDSWLARATIKQASRSSTGFSGTAGWPPEAPLLATASAAAASNPLGMGIGGHW